jgi:hypothetical protein
MLFTRPYPTCSVTPPYPTRPYLLVSFLPSLQVLDASADGYVRGEAMVALLLREPLEGDYGNQATKRQGGAAAMAAAFLMLGSAVNQDGRSSSLTAPSGPSQQVSCKLGLVQLRLW